MAPAEVIDLISSSPPPFPPPRAIDKGKAVDRTGGKTTERNGIQPRDSGISLETNRVTTSSTADLILLSDDFDTTFDAEEPILTNTTGNKRRRLSPPARDERRAFKRSASGPTITSSRPSTRPSGSGRRKDAFDPIEFTSSPDPFTERPKQTNAKTHHDEVEIIDDDPDPFASSPKRITQAASKTIGKAPPQSSDPFASSPLPVSRNKPSESHRTTSHAISPVRRKPQKRNQEWDPISSSAPSRFSFESSPEPPSRKSGHSEVINLEDSDSAVGSEDDFPEVAQFDITKCKNRALRRTQSETIAPKSKSQPKASQKAPKKSADEKTREREARAAAKEVEKEKKAREKQEAKEAKLREKERNAALAEINKVRTDKKVSAPEMIVDVPSSLNPTTTTQLEALLEGLDVQFEKWDSPIENVIKWRRKVRSRFNDDMGIWEPIPPRIDPEKHVLVVLTADEFVSLTVEEELDNHASKMAEHFQGHQIIYLLEGLIPWMRKNRNIRNRQFTSGVRAQEQPSSTQQRRRRNAVTEGYVPEDTIEDALLQLQLMHDVFIHHATIPLETAQWITIFTQHVSTIPYKHQRDHATLAAGFCMESGQVRTGEDARDTYVRMLQEIARVTAPIAYGIAAEFGSVAELVKGLEEGGPTRLESVRKSANKDGAFSDRAIGQAVSRRIHKVFTGRDETSTDV